MKEFRGKQMEQAGGYGATKGKSGSQKQLLNLH